VLPGSDIEVVDASYVNDRGEISGMGVLSNGVCTQLGGCYANERDADPSLCRLCRPKSPRD